jgi:transcriptional regulator of heat shock response
MLSERESKILFSLIDSYIDSAAPVPSSHVARHFRYALSPATIRNHFASLEDEGLLEQPHTSSGRIPTEKAVRLYVNSLFDSYREQLEQQRELTLRTAERMRERIARKYNVIAGTMDTQRGVRISGFERLFQSPELRDGETLRHVGYALDHIANAYTEIAERMGARTMTIFIGSDFAGDKTIGTSIVIAPIESHGALFIAGPMRMPYGTIIEELLNI